MTERFQRVGMDYRFVPSEVGTQLLFQRVRDRGDEVVCQVVVCTPQGDTVITRHVNLMAGMTRGAIAELVKELHDLAKGVGVEEWKALMREAAESVIASHRKGRPYMVVEGPISRPPPPRWACDGLLLQHKINCWLGAASTGKSTLAKACCAYCASGFRFLDRPTEQLVPLYLDWEDDLDSFKRVTYDVCRNLGAYPLPRMLWRDMHGYRLRDQMESLTQIIEREQVGLLVLDAVAAAGGSTGEHMTWEAIALEMEACLGGLPPVTVLALDHVTGADHRLKDWVPMKARGAERKLEYYRCQWSLLTDDEAAECGRHVVNWHHTKLNLGAREKPFATEIVHRQDEISIVVQPIAQPTSAFSQPATETDRLLGSLGDTWRTARELALQVDGKEPSRSRIESVRKLLERAVAQKRAVKNATVHPPRYSCRQAGDTEPLNNLWGDPP